MIQHDDELKNFEANGLALPTPAKQGHVEHEGAKIWYATYGSGTPVVLLHGGLGHSGNWANQIPALTESGHQVIVIDSRGHGRSTRDSRPYRYELMASDVLAVLDQLKISKAAMVGWSDGACTSMILGMKHPERVSKVFFFACNMDPSGTKSMPEFNPLLGRCFSRHSKDYAELSATPNGFQEFVAAVDQMMKTEPNYTATELGKITVPVSLVLGEQDEFIKLEHMKYLEKSIPGSKLFILRGVSHFAPIQRADEFNAFLINTLSKEYP